jgi:hypothetical protein
MNKKHKLLHRNNEYITSKLEIIYEEDIQRIVEEKNNLQSKIDKAIEYLYEHSQYNDGDGVHYIKEDEYCVDYLLNILKEDK